MSRRRQAMKRPTRLGEKYLQVQRLRQLVEQTEKSRAGIANTRGAAGAREVDQNSLVGLGATFALDHRRVPWPRG